VASRDPLKVFSDHLRELRDKRGVSQQRLSELAGLNRNYVSDVERGAQSLPEQHPQAGRGAGRLTGRVVPWVRETPMTPRITVS